MNNHKSPSKRTPSKKNATIPSTASLIPKPDINLNKAQPLPQKKKSSFLSWILYRVSFIYIIYALAFKCYYGKPNFVCTVGNEIKHYAINPTLNHVQNTVFGSQIIEFYNLQAYPFYESNIQPIAIVSHNLYLKNVKPAIIKVSDPIINVAEVQTKNAINFVSGKYEKSEILKPFIDSNSQKLSKVYHSYVHPYTVSVYVKASDFFKFTVYPTTKELYKHNIKPFYLYHLKPFWLNRIQPTLHTASIKTYDFASNDAIPFLRKYTGVFLDKIEFFFEFQLPPMSKKLVNLLNPWYSDSFLPMIKNFKKETIDLYFKKFPVLNVFFEVPKFILNLLKEFYYIFYETVTGKQNRVLKLRRLQSIKSSKLSQMNQKPFVPTYKNSKNSIVDNLNFDSTWVKNALYSNSEIAVGSIKKASSWIFSRAGEAFLLAKKSLENNSQHESISAQPSQAIKAALTATPITTPQSHPKSTSATPTPVKRAPIKEEKVFSIQTGINDDVIPEEYMANKVGKEIVSSETIKKTPKQEDDEEYNKEILRIQREADLLKEKLKSLKNKAAQHEVKLEVQDSEKPLVISSSTSSTTTRPTLAHKAKQFTNQPKPLSESATLRNVKPEQVLDDPVQPAKPIEERNLKVEQSKHAENKPESAKPTADTPVLAKAITKPTPVIVKDNSHTIKSSPTKILPADTRAPKPKNHIPKEPKLSPSPVKVEKTTAILDIPIDINTDLLRAIPKDSDDTDNNVNSKETPINKDNKPIVSSKSSLEIKPSTSQASSSSADESADPTDSSSSKANKLEDFVIVRNENQEHNNEAKKDSIPENLKKDPKQAASDWVKEAKQSISKEMAEIRSREGVSKSAPEPSVVENENNNAAREAFPEKSAIVVENSQENQPIKPVKQSTVLQQKESENEIHASSESNRNVKPVYKNQNNIKIAPEGAYVIHAENASDPSKTVSSDTKSSKQPRKFLKKAEIKPQTQASATPVSPPDLKSDTATRSIKLVKRKKKLTA
ncbi:hypothetical protein AYI69_g1227 [Smittium culicis]|uniref:Uncharacterized protein n=1 Tax=Smittium culicis TaxID=133412 RepID=A0A1R1YQV3_9FUNG|nr:hypothetical protein AYI69_g1227 [Smittium culicis]